MLPFLLHTLKIAVEELSDGLKTREKERNTNTRELGQTTEGTFLFKRKSREDKKKNSYLAIYNPLEYGWQKGLKHLRTQNRIYFQDIFHNLKNKIKLDNKYI